MTLPFENDTGPVIKKLASRSIQTDKRRNLFVIVTIALAAALMAAIFCAGAGSDRKLEADIRGQYQAVVVNCDHDTIERLKDCPEVERWGLSQNYGSARLLRGFQNNQEMPVLPEFHWQPAEVSQ